MRAIKAIKRWLVIVPVAVLIVVGVVLALFVWLLMGKKASRYSFPFESWAHPLMNWAER